ncbi:MAG: c-type cytochrome [Chromatiales bacterium]
MNNTITATTALTVALACATANAGGDYAAGEKKAKEVCAACHGADGNSPSGAFPKLAGQWESYLIQAMREYKSGERKNAVMVPQAASLSEQEILDTAAYFSQQKPALFVIER